MPSFYLDTSQVKRFADKLRTMHRSNMPIAVRQTLNDAAFDVMKNTLPMIWKDDFIVRNKSFLRSHSGVEKADGWEINGMQSKVGITPKGSEAANDLTKQEIGGSEKKPFVYMNPARVSNSNLKVVQKKNYFNKIGMLKGKPNKMRSAKSQYIADAYVALKEGLLMLTNTRSGQILVKVESMRSNVKSMKMFIKTTPIASYKKGRMVQLTPHHFLEQASEVSAKKMEHYFIENAKKRIEKALR